MIKLRLNENLSNTINYDCFEPMVLSCKNAGVKVSSYASSIRSMGSAILRVRQPRIIRWCRSRSTTYQGLCEPLLWKYNSDTSPSVVIHARLRSCGYEPRTRLDLSVNISPITL